MKVKFIFPPQWTPLSPYYAPSSLCAHLKHAGFEVTVRDLNIEFYNKVLTGDYLVDVVDKAADLIPRLYQKILKTKGMYKREEDYPFDYKNILHKYDRLIKFKELYFQKFVKIANELDEAVKIMKSKERFYNPIELVKAINTIDDALNLISMPYSPNLLSFNDYSTPLLKLDYNSILQHCNDRSGNIFLEYYEEIFEELISDNPQLITISINSTSQMIGGLTLAKMLKEKTNGFINVGGNYFGRVIDSLEKRPDFFRTFVHGINYSEGELPIVEIAKFVNGQIKVEDIPNFVYLDVDNKVKATKECLPLTLDAMQNQDLSDFKLDLYFSPEIVLPTQSSRGCYWQNCSFCDHFYGLSLNVKSVDRLVKDIKKLQEKSGIKYIEFTDESMHPDYIEEFSRKVLEEGLEIYWFCNARTENEFTKERLELAYKAGLRMLLWGVESGSERIMKLINKGVEINNRMNILKDSSEAKIWNFAFVFFGFPSETWEEAEKTIKMLCDSKGIINSYGRSNFCLGKHTKLQQNPGKYSITKIIRDSEEFSPSYSFETSEGMNEVQRREIAKVCTQICQDAYKNPLWMYLRYREILFLYICKYGRDWVFNYDFMEQYKKDF